MSDGRSTAATTVKLWCHIAALAALCAVLPLARPAGAASSNPNDLLAEARRLSVSENRMEREKAKSILQRLLPQMAGDVEPYLILGSIFERDKQFAQAAAVLENATRRLPDQPSLWWALSRLYLAARQYPRADVAFQRLASLRDLTVGEKEFGDRLYEEMMRAYAQQGAQLAGAKRTDEAIRSYVAAGVAASRLGGAESSKSQASLHAALADLYLAKGDAAKAIESIAQSFACDPLRADVAYRAATLEEKAGRTHAALAHYRACLAIAPNDPRAGQVKAAVARLEPLAAADTGVKAGKLPEGTILVLPVGEPDTDLLRILLPAVETRLGIRLELLPTEPLEDRFRAATGTQYEASEIGMAMQKKHAERLGAYGHWGMLIVTEKDLYDPESVSEIPGLFFDHTLAIVSYHDVTADLPGVQAHDEKVVRRMLVWLTAAVARTTGMDPCVRQACVLRLPDDVNDLGTMPPRVCPVCAEQFAALVAFRRGDAKTARARYDDLMRRYPDDVNLLVGRAWMAHELGDDAEAKRLLERALELDPDNPRAKRLRESTDSDGRRR